MVARIASSHVWLVAERSEELVGYAYAAPFHRRSAYRWSIEVSVYLREDARGQGLGRRLVGEVLEQARSRGFVNAFAGATLPNPASVKLFESLGFAQVAHQRAVGFKLGRWHDVGWWQLHLRERTVPPPALP
jgi:phosphinothricin acetyltransferase